MNAAAPVPAGLRHRLHVLLPYLSLLAASIALWPSLHSLLVNWHDIKDYQHGYLIAPLAAVWIGWTIRRTAAQEGNPSIAAAALLAVVLLAWLVALRSGFDIVHQLLWPAALWLCVWTSFGWPQARRLFPPIALLYFAIPVWDYALPVLQRLSIFASEHLLALLGVPAQVTEYRVTIPEGTFAILEGCSGKRYFIVALAVAWLAVAMNQLGVRRALVYLASTAFLAMLTNWIRIVIVIYAGHVSNMQSYLVAVEHLTLGTAMFAVLLVLVLLLGRWLAGQPHVATQASSLPAAEAGAAHGPLPLITSLVPLLLVPLALLLAERHVGSVESSLGSLPVATDRWQGPLPPRSGWYPHFAFADLERRASYSAGGDVEVYVNLYATQLDGREMIHYGNNLVAPAGWSEYWSDETETISANGRPVATARMRAPDDGSWLLTYVYVVGHADFRSATLAKLAYGWQSLFGPTPSGIIAVASRCQTGNCDQTRTLVADFWDNLQPDLRAMMPERVSRRR